MNLKFNLFSVTYKPANEILKTSLHLYQHMHMRMYALSAVQIHNASIVVDVKCNKAGNLFKTVNLPISHENMKNKNKIISYLKILYKYVNLKLS